MGASGEHNFQESVERLGLYFSPAQLAFMVRMAKVYPGPVFLHSYQMVTPSGRVECRININTGENPKIGGYRATLYKLPNYAPGAYNGVETFWLEARMKASAKRLRRQDFDLVPGIFGDILQMAAEGPMGKAAGDALMLKYWLGTPVEEYLDFSLLRKNHAHSLYCPLEGSHLDLRVGEAYRLLTGNAVFKPRDGDKPTYLDGNWIFTTNTKTTIETVHMSNITPAYDLLAVLGALPYSVKPSEAGLKEMLHRLLQGLEIKADLCLSGSNSLSTISATPANQGVLITGSSGESVAYCVPATSEKNTAEKTNKGRTTSKEPRRNKGKSL